MQKRRCFAGSEKLTEQIFKSTKTDGSESLFGEVILIYTRAQAIADRELIDVLQPLWRPVSASLRP